MNYQKEFRKFKKLLKKDGYKQLTKGNHPKFQRGEFIVTVSQNCNDAQKAMRDVRTNFNRSKVQ